jgi:hypothetical protein
MDSNSQSRPSWPHQRTTSNINILSGRSSSFSFSRTGRLIVAIRLSTRAAGCRLVKALDYRVRSSDRLLRIPPSGFRLRERSFDADCHPRDFIAVRIVHRNPTAVPGVVFRQFLGDLYRVRFRGQGAGMNRLAHVLEGFAVRNYEAIPFHRAPRSNVAALGI